MTATIHAIDPDAKPKRERPKREPKKNGRPAKVVPIAKADGSAAIIGRLVAIIDQGVMVVENPDAMLPHGSPVHPENRWCFAPEVREPLHPLR